MQHYHLHLRPINNKQILPTPIGVPTGHVRRRLRLDPPRERREHLVDQLHRMPPPPADRGSRRTNPRFEPQQHSWKTTLLLRIGE